MPCTPDLPVDRTWTSQRVIIEQVNQKNRESWFCGGKVNSKTSYHSFGGDTCTCVHENVAVCWSVNAAFVIFYLHIVLNSWLHVGTFDF